MVSLTLLPITSACVHVGNTKQSYIAKRAQYMVLARHALATVTVGTKHVTLTSHIYAVRNIINDQKYTSGSCEGLLVHVPWPISVQHPKESFRTHSSGDIP